MSILANLGGTTFIASSKNYRDIESLEQLKDFFHPDNISNLRLEITTSDGQDHILNSFDMNSFIEWGLMDSYGYIRESQFIPEEEYAAAKERQQNKKVNKKGTIIPFPTTEK
ncbi:hypothetical protein [Niallia taxi]|uniref:hypothetical protein n=1 Tax=Niallia taxi TaxID=2499688 RepID=UPI0015F558BA|nr:hypothetical protein [Niallia taxi]